MNKKTIKQPWEITKWEFFGREMNPVSHGKLNEHRHELFARHKKSVIQAIKKGKIKQHPDYPELQQNPTPTPSQRKDKNNE